MTVVACILAVALVAVVWLLLRHHSQLEQAWTTERRELLTRIQAPERIPMDSPVEFAVPEPEPDEMDKVGTIAYEQEG